MTEQFYAIPNPDDAVLSALAEADPANPFLTRGFLAYRTDGRPDITPFALGVRSNDHLLSGCIGYLQKSRLPWSNRLEIHSLALPGDQAINLFWEGLWRFCRREQISRLVLLSFGSAGSLSLPTGSNRLWYRERCEYLLDLNTFEGLKSLSSNHRRNVNRAERAGIRMTESQDAVAAGTHAELMGQSLDRRRLRGESVGEGNSLGPTQGLLASGAARIFQAKLDEQVLSSILVLQSRTGAYYHSAGTSPEGMKAGASHLLLTQLAGQLQREGCAVFNLGGSDSEGLARFKSGLGAKPVTLEAAAYDTGDWKSRLVGLMASGLRRLRS